MFLSLIWPPSVVAGHTSSHVSVTFRWWVVIALLSLVGAKMLFAACDVDTGDSGWLENKNTKYRALHTHTATFCLCSQHASVSVWLITQERRIKDLDLLHTVDCRAEHKGRCVCVLIFLSVSNMYAGQHAVCECWWKSERPNVQTVKQKNYKKTKGGRGGGVRWKEKISLRWKNEMKSKRLEMCGMID